MACIDARCRMEFATTSGASGIGSRSNEGKVGLSKERVCPACHGPSIEFRGARGEDASCTACGWAGRPVELAYKPRPSEVRNARNISGYTPFEIGLGFGLGFALAHGFLGAAAGVLYLALK